MTEMSTELTAETAEAAQRVLEFWTPDKFCKRWLATDEKGSPMDPESPEAERFCWLGVQFKLKFPFEIQQQLGQHIKNELHDLHETRWSDPIKVNDLKRKDGQAILRKALTKIVEHAKGE